MKKIAVNILCSTGITLLILAIIGLMFGAEFLCISSVFQSFIANIIIHIGLLFTHKFESNYAVLEYMLDIGFTIVVAFVSGVVFNWYNSTPIWILIVMSIIIYLSGVLLKTIQIRHDIEEINLLLKKRNYKSTSKETQI